MAIKPPMPHPPCKSSKPSVIPIYCLHRRTSELIYSDLPEDVSSIILKNLVKDIIPMFDASPPKNPLVFCYIATESVANTILHLPLNMAIISCNLREFTTIIDNF